MVDAAAKGSGIATIRNDSTGLHLPGHIRPGPDDLACDADAARTRSASETQAQATGVSGNSVALSSHAANRVTVGHASRTLCAATMPRSPMAGPRLER